ncbi:hypothetical protein CFRS1_v012980 [Colletotrichum fructicola]|nr:hypothetical protein CFRS1_v012980 [Colletotrichum fructicola]
MSRRCPSLRDPLAGQSRRVAKLKRISIDANFDPIDELETRRSESRPYHIVTRKLRTVLNPARTQTRTPSRTSPGCSSDPMALESEGPSMAVSGERQPVPREDAVMLAKYLASRDSTVTETLAVVASGSGSGSAAASSASTDRLREKTQQVDALLQQLKQAGGGNGGNSTRL